MSQQYDSLNEKTKLIDLALKYTGSDLAKAKAMVAGQYEDIVAIKGKFLVSELNQSGIFIIFFNIFDEYIAYLDSIIFLNSEMFEKARIFDDWKIQINDLNEYLGRDDLSDSREFNNFFLESLIRKDAFPDVREQNLVELTKTIKEILILSFNKEKISCQIEVEITSSLALELGGIIIDVPGAGETGEGAGEEQAEITEEDERIAKIEKEAKYIIHGAVLVAPVKGTYINDINTGEKIKVLLTDQDAVSQKILSVLNAVDVDGKVSSISGRLKEKIPMEKGGYILYALVAKEVLVKIIEEENVKIDVESVFEEKQNENRMGDTKSIFLIIALVVLILISAVILIQFL